MGEKRRSNRVRRRLPVVFFDGQEQHKGHTANLSRTGVGINSDYVVAPRTRITLRLTLPGIAEVTVHAEVEWARKLRGSDALQSSNSMGLRFLTAPGPDYDAFMDMIDGMAQAHGFTTRAAPPATPDLPVPPLPPATPPPAPRGEPPADPGVSSPGLLGHNGVDLDAIPLTPVERPPQRPLPYDPRREPDPGEPLGRRELPLSRAPIVEVQPRQREATPLRSRLEKNLDFVVGPDDLAAPLGYPASLSTARAAWLLEQGAAELIAPRLRGRMATVGRSLEVEVDESPLEVGTPLSVTVALAQLGSDRRTFGFELEITAGTRRVATGRHVRALVDAIDE